MIEIETDVLVAHFNDTNMTLRCASVDQVYGYNIDAAPLINHSSLRVRVSVAALILSYYEAFTLTESPEMLSVYNTLHSCDTANASQALRTLLRLHKNNDDSRRACVLAGAYLQDENIELRRDAASVIHQLSISSARSPLIICLIPFIQSVIEKELDPTTHLHLQSALILLTEFEFGPDDLRHTDNLLGCETWPHLYIKEPEISEHYPLKELGLKLTKKEQDSFEKGVNQLAYQSVPGMIEHFENSYEMSIELCEKKNKQEIEETFHFLFSRCDNKDLLYFYYYSALIEKNPQILLNAYYTHNHINAMHVISSGYDHCSHWFSVIKCYAGNNYDLVDYYYPKAIGESTNGHRFLIMATNLILAIRGELDTSQVNKLTTIFHTRKNGKSDIAIINALSAILNNDYHAFSQQLAAIAKVYKGMKSIHDLENPILKHLPFIHYGLLSILHKHRGSSAIKNIEIPKINAWWDDFIALNVKNSFAQGEHIIIFEGRLSCLNSTQLPG